MSPVCRPKDTNDSQYSNYVTSYACLQNGKGLPRAKTEVATGHRVQKRPSATEGSLPSQKKFHHATPQPINTDGSSQSGRRCLSRLSIPWSKNTVSVLLYRTHSLSVGANERHLSRRNLIWVPDPEGSLTKVNICTYCILKKFNSRMKKVSYKGTFNLGLFSTRLGEWTKLTLGMCQNLQGYHV